MEYRRLGDSGLVVSTVGLGCNNLGRPGTTTEKLEGARAVTDAAIDSGITFFDVADVYGAPRGRSEALLGEALGKQREKVVVATKFGLDMQGSNGADFGARASRGYVRRAVESSLRRLGTEWIDLYQLHRPDFGTPLAETLSVLDDLVREGKIRYAGMCNMASWQLADAAWTAMHHNVTPPVATQNHYSLLERETEREILPAARRFKIGLLPYFPLANGLLTGKYTKDGPSPEGARLTSRQRLLTEAPWTKIEALRNLAAERDISMPTMAIGWLAAQRGVASVMAGATTPEQVRVNAAGANWHPSNEDLAAIDEISPPGRR
jgi:aryl-alcohol dehydrogenase-like predicted oxidoreductase